jgi:glycosyltransferase involved in cell wall biosynthesis
MISIIIPTLNEEKVIGETLSRLQSELTLPREIIVSDGRSRDKTIEIAKNFTDTVLVHAGAGRQTIGQGRNAGAKISRGEFLVFIDADCMIPDPDRFFSSALSRFQEEGELVALTAYLRVFPETETIGDKVVSWTRNFGVRVSNNFFKKGDCAGGEFQMIRKEAFFKIGGYREDLVTCEDRDLFRRLARVGRTMSDPNLTVFHSARRAHILGWPYLIGLFFINTIFFRLRGRCFSKDWEPVR